MAAADRLIMPDLASIRCPVLALAGELDLLAPPPAVAALHRTIPGVHNGVIAGAAHSVHWERPQETAAAVLAFLR